ncbi:hypothetical protein NX059_010798 [Plenodomus lindquistii]|nr:hypothetical protein NX059_010798 [Plenodomus lindquistii]
MRSFATLAFLALPLFGSVFAEAPVAISKVDAIYASAQEAFQDLLNALPEDSLQAALSGLKDFKTGVFESHHRGVEHVHNSNPALATKLIVAAVRDLQKRQAPGNGTTTVQTTAQQPPASSQAPPPESTQDQPQPTQDQPQPTQQTSQGQQPPASSAAAPAPETTTTTAARPVIIPVEQTITTGGSTVVQTTEVFSEVTASVAVTVVRTNNEGATVTTTENRPAIIMTTTDSAGREQVTTSAGNLAPTFGEVLTSTNQEGSTFLTTYTPSGSRVSSVKLITTTGADGRPRTLTSYTFVDPAAPTQTGGNTPDQTQTGRPGLQTNAANKNLAMGYAVVGGALAMFV